MPRKSVAAGLLLYELLSVPLPSFLKHHASVLSFEALNSIATKSVHIGFSLVPGYPLQLTELNTQSCDVIHRGFTVRGTDELRLNLHYFLLF